jgi:hypothetical protein
MTWVKKLNPEWQPQEFPTVQVGEVVNFPGPIDKLVADGIVMLCDEDGNEVSAYDSLGVTTERELEEFRTWRRMQGQETLKKILEKEKDSLLAEAAKLKKDIAEDVTTVEDKKQAFVEKMKAAKAAKKAKEASV